MSSASKGFVLRSIFSIILCLGLSVPSWGAPLSLKEAAKLALESSPILRSVEVDREVSRLEYKNVVGRFLPSLDSSLSGGYAAGEPNPVGSKWPNSLELGLSETLYDNGATWTKWQQAGVNREVQDLAYQSAREELLLVVSRSFYQHSYYSKAIEAYRQKLSMIEKQLKLVESEYRQGLKAKKDFLRVRANFLRVDLEIRSADGNRLAQLQELRSIAGQEGSETAFEIQTESVPDRPIEIPRVPLRLADHLDYRKSELQRKVYALNVDIVERNFWPRLSVSGGVNYEFNQWSEGGPGLKDNITDPNGGTLSWNILGKIEFNIWDWGIRRRNVDLAKAEELKSNLAVDHRRLEIQRDAENLTERLQRLNHEYEVGRELHTTEQESYQLIDSDYRQGKVTFLEMVTAIEGLTTARLIHYRAYFDLQVALHEQQLFRGKLYETLLL